MALDWTVFERELAEFDTVVESAVAALKTVAEGIRDAGANQAKLNALASQLDARAGTVAAAIAANTAAVDPALPTPEPAPTTPVVAIPPIADAIVPADGTVTR
jgi:hypothetical protein